MSQALMGQSLSLTLSLVRIIRTHDLLIRETQHSCIDQHL